MQCVIFITNVPIVNPETGKNNIVFAGNLSVTHKKLLKQMMLTEPDRTGQNPENIPKQNMAPFDYPEAGDGAIFMFCGVRFILQKPRIRYYKINKTNNGTANKTNKKRRHKGNQTVTKTKKQNALRQKT